MWEALAVTYFLPLLHVKQNGYFDPTDGGAQCGLRELWFFVRIGPIRFLAGCRKRRLNQG